jgi:hypothetical protein
MPSVEEAFTLARLIREAGSPASLTNANAEGRPRSTHGKMKQRRRGSTVLLNTPPVAAHLISGTKGDPCSPPLVHARQLARKDLGSNGSLRFAIHRSPCPRGTWSDSKRCGVRRRGGIDRPLPAPRVYIFHNNFWVAQTVAAVIARRRGRPQEKCRAARGVPQDMQMRPT